MGKTAGKYTSQRALAKAVGVAASTLAGWVKRDDFPVRKSAPWTAAHLRKLKDWQRWLQDDRSGKSHQADDGLDSDTAKSASKRAQIDSLLKYQRMRRAKVEADEAEGRVVPRDLLERALTGMTGMFVSKLEDIQESLAYQLDGDPRKNSPTIKTVFDEMRNSLIAHAQIELNQVADSLQASRDKKISARGRPGQSKTRNR